MFWDVQSFPEAVDEGLEQRFVVRDCLENISIRRDISYRPLTQPCAAQPEYVTKKKTKQQRQKLVRMPFRILNDLHAQNLTPHAQWPGCSLGSLQFGQAVLWLYSLFFSHTNQEAITHAKVGCRIHSMTTPIAKAEVMQKGTYRDCRDRKHMQPWIKKAGGIWEWGVCEHNNFVFIRMYEHCNSNYNW